MSDALEQLDVMVSQFIADQARPTEESIRANIKMMRVLPPFAEVTDEQAEVLARRIEERIGISMGIGAVVSDAEWVPWLNDAKATGRIDPYYWNRYRSLMRKKRLPRDVIISTDEVTDRILDRMGNPGDENPWDRKGMVVGHVQSGKTANYTGLVCKAADAGYRLIVIIAGIHNNLRNQTQARIDEGFVGRDTGRLEKRDTREKPKIIGVGTFDDRRVPVSLTTTLKDFNKATATTNTSQIASYKEPVVLVIKKNSRTLANLIDWLREHSTGRYSEMVDQPMLLIDDEADNASINIKYGKEEVSKINGQIRDLLGLFRRSCYVGYTATPFANIFIDPDSEDEVYKQDLFPRHFIIGLDAPTNYFGARKVFLDGVPENDDESPAHLRYINDNDDLLPVKHPIHHPVTDVPDSMVDALRAFIVSRAIRNLRGQTAQHASMLVNASRFTGIQNLLRNRLLEQLRTIEDAVRVDGAKPDADHNPVIGALRDCWAAEFSAAWPDWPSIRAVLLPVVASATVISVNNDSSGSLDYDTGGENGLTVVAVGGFSLSRGLTLEGLTVSYFLRNSMMYDTLMQMGRWFGYRGDYEDLCRVWMPREAAAWYAHIAEATEELQLELKRMDQARATPMQFGLAVRSHPSALMVTARNKMGSGVKHVLVGLSNSFVETTRLGLPSIPQNRLARNRLMQSLADAGFNEISSVPAPGGKLLKGVPVGFIDSFLREFQNHPESTLSAIDPIRRYIADRRGDELRLWDVLVASVTPEPDKPVEEICGWNIVPLRRSVGEADLPSGVLSLGGASSRVASRGMEMAGLEAEEIEAAKKSFREGQPEPAGKSVNYPDRIFRAVRKRPLLLLYNIRIKDDRLSDENRARVPEGAVVGWGISFPVSGRPDQKVEYILNTTKLRELFGEDDEDEDGASDYE